MFQNKPDTILESDVNIENGIATGGSQTTLIDTSKSLSTNLWKGAFIEIVISGISYIRTIISNTVNTITFATLPGVITVVSGNEYNIKLPTGNFIMAEGTNFIGRSGSKSFKVAVNFTRPNDNNVYTRDDAITNSTSAPTILSFDLASYGAIAGQFFEIKNARVIISTKTSSGTIYANIWIYNKTFASTNDNAELSIDDTTSQLGGITIPCDNAFSNAANQRAVSAPGGWMGQLDAADTNIYFVIQAADAFTIPAQSRIDVVMEGVLL